MSRSLLSFLIILGYILADCGAPPTVEHSTMTGTGTLIHSTRTYTCIAKHKMAGSATITCLGSFKWESPPTCPGMVFLMSLSE